MKYPLNELRDQSVDEIKAKTVDLKKELFNLRVQQALGQIENPMRIRTLRKSIAKTLTIAREKNG